jgi:hypothetical protein
MLTYRDETLFIPLTQNLEHPFLQPHVTDLQMAEFRYPHAGIKQGQDDGMVPITFRGSGIYYVEQLLYLGVSEGRDDFSGWSRGLYPVKGVAVYDIFRD